MLELDHYIEERGYDPSGNTNWVGKMDSFVKFWRGDEEYINAVLQLIDDNKISYTWRLNRKNKYFEHGRELERFNPVMNYQVAKRYGEYSYTHQKWRPIILKKD